MAACPCALNSWLSRSKTGNAIAMVVNVWATLNRFLGRGYDGFPNIYPSAGKTPATGRSRGFFKAFPLQPDQGVSVAFCCVYPLFNQLFRNIGFLASTSCILFPVRFPQGSVSPATSSRGCSKRFKVFLGSAGECPSGSRRGVAVSFSLL